MCSPARCARCGKTTWRGCGQHIDEVMAEIRPDQRCRCDNPEPMSLLRQLFARHPHTEKKSDR